MPEKKIYFPILIDLNQFPVLVIGGGKVAHRKTANLIEFGMEPVDVIAPEVCADMHGLIEAGKVNYINRKFKPGDVSGYRLVFCATDDESLDAQIKSECARDNVLLLNVADMPEISNFVMPATIKRGDFTVSFSAQGKAPFFVKQKKEQFEKILSPMVADVAELAGNFRKRLLAETKHESPEKKYHLFHEFLLIDWEEILYEEGKEGAYKLMDSLFEELK